MLKKLMTNILFGISILFFSGCLSLGYTKKNVVLFSIENLTVHKILNVKVKSVNSRGAGGDLKVFYDKTTNSGSFTIDADFNTIVFYVQIQKGEIIGAPWVRFNYKTYNELDFVLYEKSDKKVYVNPRKDYLDEIAYIKLREEEAELERTTGLPNRFIISVINETNKEFSVSAIKINKNETVIHKYPIGQYSAAQIDTTYLVKNGISETSGIRVFYENSVFEIEIPTFEKPDYRNIYIRGFSLNGQIYYVITK